MSEANYDTNGQGCSGENCTEMVGELSDIATWLAKEQMTPADFAATIAIFEAKKLQRFGLKLSSAVSNDSLVHFSLRFVNSGELCASMDVDPATGEIIVQRACA